MLEDNDIICFTRARAETCLWTVRWWVTAPNATLADASSTACAVVDDEAAEALCSRLRCDLRIYRGGERLA